MNATHEKHRPRDAARRARGSAMSETVLVLPLLFLIFVLVIYMGRGVVRAQRGQVLDRYEAWRAVDPVGHVLPGTENEIDTRAGTPAAPQSDQPSNAALNQVFFGDNAESVIGRGARGFPTDAMDRLEQAASGYSRDSFEIAQAMASTLPGGIGAGFDVTHTPDNAFWGGFETPASHSHTRLNGDWSFASGWRRVELDAGVILGWNYVTMIPWPLTQLDPQRKTGVLLTDGTGLFSRVVGTHGAGGGVMMSDAGYRVWRRSGERASNFDAVRRSTLRTFDESIRTLQANNGDNRLARGMRELYASPPHYAGPTVEWRSP